MSGPALLVAALTRVLEAESDRLSLWIPVLFAGGMLIYFGLTDEPRIVHASALVMAATGIYLAARGTGLGLVLGAAALALAAGFATAKLHTETARPPVLAKELHGVTVRGWVESYELRDKARARITLRVISLGELKPEETPYRVRLTLPAASAQAATGDAVSFKATLGPPPEPIAPHGFDLARTAWFDRLGATGYGTAKVDSASRRGHPARWLAALGRNRSSPFARQCPHSLEPCRRARRDRRCAHHRRARRHLRRGQSGDAQLRPVPHSVDFRPAHGAHGGNGVLAGQSRACAHPIACAPLPHQEVGGWCGARGGPVLSAFVGCRRSNGSFLDHNEHRAAGGDPRSAGAHHAQRGARSLAHPSGRS